MTAEQLEAGLARVYKNFYSGKRRLRRFAREVRRRDPRFHGALTTCNVNYSTRYRDIHYSEEPGYEASPEDIAALTTVSAVPAQEALAAAFSNVQLTTRPVQDAQDAQDALAAGGAQ